MLSSRALRATARPLSHHAEARWSVDHICDRKMAGGRERLVQPAEMPVHGALAALDISKKRIGSAVCDPDRIVASPLENWVRAGWQDDVGRVAELATSHAICGLVVGLPLNMDGTAGPAAQSRRDTAVRLAAEFPALLVMLQDERLTSAAVSDAFAEGRWRRPKAGKAVDHFAAALILEDAIRTIARARKERKEV